MPHIVTRFGTSTFQDYGDTPPGLRVFDAGFGEQGNDKGAGPRASRFLIWF